MNQQKPQAPRRGPILVYAILMLLMLFALYKLYDASNSVDMKYSDVVTLFQEEKVESFSIRSNTLEMKLKDAKLPVMVIFEGWGAAGKGSVIGRVIRNIDPRFFRVRTFAKPTAEEKRYPFLRRYLLEIPEEGKFTFFDGYWMNEVTGPRLEGKLSDAEYRQREQQKRGERANALIPKKEKPRWTKEEREKFRKERDLTRNELAELIGVTMPTIYRWENGDRLPDIVMLMKLARILGVKYDRFMRDSGDQLSR